MSMVNNFCILKGNLVRDPLRKDLPSGKTVRTFSLANNYGPLDQQKVSFFDIEVWDIAGADLVSEFKKGDRVVVTGQLRQDRWEKEGQLHSRVKMVAASVARDGSFRKNPAADRKDQKNGTNLAKAG